MIALIITNTVVQVLHSFELNYTYIFIAVNENRKSCPQKTCQHQLPVSISQLLCSSVYLLPNQMP